MATLEARLAALAQAVGTDIKAINRTLSRPALVARTLLSTAIVAMNNNVRTRRVMDRPPVQSVTATKPAGFTVERRLNASPNNFFVAGGQPVNTGAFVEIRSVTPTGTTQLQHYWRVIFRADCAKLCFEGDGGGTVSDGYRFIVDGQYVSLDGAVSGSGTRYHALDFGSHASRTIQIEGSVGQRFGAIHLEADGEIFKAFDERPLKMIVVGDSNAATNGIDLEGESYAAIMADHLGIRDVAISAVSGSGFVSPWGGHTYYGRRQDWESVEGDILVFRNSVNDINYIGQRDNAFGTTQMNELRAAMMQCYTAARAGSPNRLILFSGLHSWGNWQPEDIPVLVAFEDAVAADLAATGDPHVAFVRVASLWPGEMAIAPAREARYIASNDHMNIAGNRFFGQFLARKVVEKVAEHYGLPAPTYLESLEEPRLFHIGPTPPSDTGLIWIDTSGS